MTTVQLMQLRIAQQYKASIDDIVQKATTTLRNASSIQDFTIGTEQEDNNVIQIVIQDTDPTNCTTTTELLNGLHKFLITPPIAFRLTFNNPPFALYGPATAPVVEYAQSWFPVSDATPAFKQQIEQDFVKFTEIFKRETKGDVGCAYGWVEEELEKDDVQGRKSTSFIVTRGWETSEDFKMSTSTESFREAVPILYRWGAPHRMWFVERKGGS